MPQDIFAQGGKCGELLRSLDWDTHPLGPPERWPHELRAVLQIVLAAQQPMFVLWGPEQIVLYNDPCAAVYGPQHPYTLGKRFKDTLGQLWEQVEPIVIRAYQGISGGGVDVPFMMTRRGYAEHTHVSYSSAPVRSAQGDVQGMFCAFIETTGRVAVEHERDREQGRLRSIFETALGAVAVTSGRSHHITYVNNEFEAMSGYRSALGKTVHEAFPDVAGQGVFEMLDDVFRQGRPQVRRAMPVTLQPGPETPAEERVVDIMCHPIASPNGATEGVFVQLLDVTDSHLLSKELAHRLKNQLTVVQAIVNQSFRGAKNMAEAQAVLAERIGVLARAHEATIAANDSGVPLRRVIRTAVEWHDFGRISLNGPEVIMAARPALSLALIMHELLTNAIKHGALSNETGRVAIAWSVTACPGGPGLQLVWEESGGPPVTGPQRRGAGYRLIHAGLSGAPAVKVRLEFAPAGVRCVMNGEMPGLGGAD